MSVEQTSVLCARSHRDRESQQLCAYPCQVHGDINDASGYLQHYIYVLSKTFEMANCVSNINMVKLPAQSCSLGMLVCLCPRVCVLRRFCDVACDGARVCDDFVAVDDGDYDDDDDGDAGDDDDDDDDDDDHDDDGEYCVWVHVDVMCGVSAV